MSASLAPELVALEHRFVLQAREVSAGGRAWRLEMPRSAEDLISEADFARDERLPYWADLWPSAIVLASEVAAAAGFAVTVTDYYQDALLFARRNAASNLGCDLATALVDWRTPPALPGRFDLVLAADVLYERPYAPLVARAVLGALAPDGVTKHTITIHEVRLG